MEVDKVPLRARVAKDGFSFSNFGLKKDDILIEKDEICKALRYRIIKQSLERSI